MLKIINGIRSYFHRREKNFIFIIYFFHPRPACSTRLKDKILSRRRGAVVIVHLCSPCIRFLRPIKIAVQLHIAQTQPMRVGRLQVGR